MNKLTKLLTVFAVAGAMAGAVAGSGCSHKHSYDSEWSKDENNHWHQATCDHSDEKGDFGAHVDEKINGTDDVGHDFICDICGYDSAVHVDSIELNKDKTTIRVGESETLRATIKPENANNKNRTWTSSDPEVASVDGNVVSAHKVGTAIITVTTEDGNKEATCEVTVTDGAVRVTSIELDVVTATLKIGADRKLAATILPSNATNKNRTWSSSDPSIASVNNNVVTAHRAGTAIITVTTEDGGHTAECIITVTNEIAEDVKVESVELNKEQTTIKAGESETLRATILPSNATNQGLRWESSDPEIASVNGNTNVVTAHKKGTAIITVTTEDGGKTATCVVTVTEGAIPVTGITLLPEEVTLEVGKTETLRAQITPENADNLNRRWESSDPAVATVSNNVVTALKAGTTIITVTTEDGNHSASCTVTVIDKKPTPETKYTVTYEINGHGAACGSVTEVTALPATLPTLSEEGWTFGGWYYDNNTFTRAAKAGDAITANTTLYAKWTENQETPPPVVGDEMTAEQFKAAIQATLDATAFTYTAKGSSVKIDSAKNAFAVAGSYELYDINAKNLTSYSPIADIAWEKKVQAGTYADFAAAKDSKAVGMTATLNQFKDADFSTVTFDKATGRYTLGSSYVTITDGKVSSFGTAEVGDAMLSGYGEEIVLPDLTNAFENVVAVKIAKNDTITKLPLKGGSYGLYADDAAMTTAGSYIEVTANGYAQKVTEAAANNKGTIISFAKLEGKIEGYFEFSASKVGSKNDMLCLRSGGSKILCLRTGDDSKKLVFRKKIGDGDTATFSDISGLTPVANTVYKVRYTFEQGSDGNYSATIIINGTAFVTNEALGVSTLDGFTLGCSNANVDTNKGTTVVDNVRLITVNNVIICGIPTEGAEVPVDSITLNKNVLNMQIGATEQLTATVLPDNAADKSVKWSSSNEAVATVDANGLITAIKAGTATISAISSNGKTVKCEVTVAEKPKPSYQIQFWSDGVLKVTETAKEGERVLAPVGIEKEGFTLDHWAIGSVDGAAFDFQTPIEGNMVLHAVWVEGEKPPVVDPDPDIPNPPVENAEITYSYFGNEAAAFEWEDTNAKLAKVEYALNGTNNYVEVDNELIRQLDKTTARVDIVGLKGNAYYDFKITPYGGEAIPMVRYRISAYDRSGYAHFKYTEGVGAYNDDGTLKDKAIVLYVTDENKNTIELTYGGVTVTGIGNILNSVGQDVGGGKTSNGGTKPNTNQGIIKKLAEANIPLVVRFIGCVSDSGLYKKATFAASSTPKIDGLTIYNSTDHGGSVGDNGHMARIKSGKDITLEGVGEDAVIDGWGFHYMAESSSSTLGKSFEVRNLTFINTPEDAIGMEGVQEGGVITAGVERCWIHNNEFYCPQISSPAESDKAQGDGSCDFKRGQYLTCSYNYFEGCHKTNLVGSSDSSLQYNLTYHHNYWRLCESRGPLARQANIHMYNNVFEQQTSYAMNTRANSYIFSEYNLFYMCKNPQTITSGGVIKSFNDSFSSCINDMQGTIVTDKTQAVSNNCKYGNIDYSKFELTAAQSYIPTGDYQLQTNVTEARKVIAAVCGVMKRNAKSANDVTLSDLSYVPSGVTPAKVEVPSTVTPGKISKTVYAFTLESSATVTVSCADGVLVNEAGECMLTGNGSVNLNPGTYMVQAMNFDPKSGAFKDMTISSISFEKYESEEFNAKLIADYDTKAGLINIDNISYDNASYQLIVNAQNAYNLLSPELKARVTVPYATVTAALEKYINLGKAEVERLIDDIGTVNENSGSKIAKARAAYQALKNLSSDVTISNYNTLVQAEAAYEQFEVLGVNNAIKALADPAGATTREAIEALLEEYMAVRDMYYDLGEDKRPSVENTQKVTNGIATLQAALKPYEVKDMLADLPASTDANYLAKVGELKSAYEALNDTQKNILSADEKSAIESAIAFYDEEMAKTVVVLFAEGNSDNYDKLKVSISGTYGNSAFTYDGTSYSRSLKMESKTNVSFTLEGEKTIVLKLSASGKRISIGGTTYTSDSNGEVSITLAAGTYSITKVDSCNLFYMIAK